MGELTSFLLNEHVGVLPVLDKYLLFFSKIIYLIIRLLFRICLGKERRDRFYVKNKIYFNDNSSPSFSLVLYTYKLIRFLKLGNPRIIKVTVPKYNYKVYCPISKSDSINLSLRELDVLEHFTPKEGNNVIDIGAHIGTYTIISSRRVSQTGKIVSIEADPANFEILKQNIKLNKLTNVTTLNHAAYSKETKIKLYLPDEQHTDTLRSTIMVDRPNTKQDRFIEVNANTLDNLLEQNGLNHAEINWIKIDVEGAEFEVLKGATNILSKSKDIAILIEIHNLYGDTNLYTPIIEFLGSYNFKIEYEKKHLGGERHVIVRKSL